MYYLIADLTVQMNPKYKPLINQIIPYHLNEVPQVVDCVIPQGNKTISTYQAKNPNLSVGEAEYLLYGAYFYDTLLKHKGIVLHASCVVYHHYAYLFSASSGIGKSTHTSIWCKLFKEAFILNDDKPALKFDGNTLFAYGTPFSGKTNQNINAKYPVAGIAFINQSSINEIKRIPAKEAMIHFMNQTMKPHDMGSLDLITSTLEHILETIPFYSFNVNMNDEAAIVAYNAMRID